MNKEILISCCTRRNVRVKDDILVLFDSIDGVFFSDGLLLMGQVEERYT